MKKTLCILLILVSVFSLYACKNSDKKVLAPVTFYYPLADTQYGTDSGVIGSEVFDAVGHEEDYAYLLRSYLAGPSNKSLISILPKGTELISFYNFDGDVQIILGPQIGQLSKSELTVACACITRTVIELTNAKSVQINTEDSLLDDIEANRFTLQDFAFFQPD